MTFTQEFKDERALVILDQTQNISDNKEKVRLQLEKINFKRSKKNLC